MKLEGYAIHCRMHRGERTGKDSSGRNVYKYITEYKTDNGTFVPEKWKEKTMKAIMAAGEMELLEKIKNYCRKHCAWLHKESELQEYAMECLVSRSYLYWNDFLKEEGRQIVTS